jgi:hypothetical protein
MIAGPATSFLGFEAAGFLVLAGLRSGCLAVDFAVGVGVGVGVGVADAVVADSVGDAV